MICQATKEIEENRNMKYLIASDIHGSSLYCQKLMEAADKEKPKRMILLGDLLYHGPRNDLPEGYEPKKVIEILNLRKDELLCVRGNCDAEVDQMVLSFPMMADYAVLDTGSRIVYASHGHIASFQNPPPLKRGDLFIQGHTHVPAFVEKDGVFFANPGSVSLPKENSWHGYMILEENQLTWKDLEGNVMKAETLS